MKPVLISIFILCLVPCLAPAQSLFEVLKTDNPQAVKAALVNGARTCDRDADGSTPLGFAAARTSSTEVIRVLLAAGADLEERDQFDMTPLMKAAASDPRSTISCRTLA